MTDTLFVKFNRGFGFDEFVMWGGYDDIENMMFVFTPEVDYPNESYQVRCYRNFISEDFYTPFKPGQIVKVVNLLEAVDTSLFTRSFSI